MVSQHQLAMEQFSDKHEEHSQWQAENLLRKRTSAHRFYTSERQAKSLFRTLLATVPPKTWTEDPTQ